MSKANENKLGALHGAVAQVLTAQISHQEEETVFDGDGEEQGTGQMRFTAQPATIAAAIKFLKDNQITCDVEVDENMNNLRESLAKKQKHSRLTSAGTAALKVVGE
tara:strand:- start:4902 stop:5219 length:318 start_codon:yes stop_codon:yes gene_type:complete